MVRLCVRNVASAVATVGTARIVIIIIVYVTTVEEHGAVLR